MHRVDIQATWYDDEEASENPEHETVELRLGYGEDALYIDGLRDDGRFLCLPLSAIGQALAEGAGR